MQTIPALQGPEKQTLPALPARQMPVNDSRYSIAEDFPIVPFL